MKTTTDNIKIGMVVFQLNFIKIKKKTVEGGPLFVKLCLSGSEGAFSEFSGIRENFSPIAKTHEVDNPLSSITYPDYDEDRAPAHVRKTPGRLSGICYL